MTSHAIEPVGYAPAATKPAKQQWSKVIARYAHPSLVRATWQLSSTLGLLAIDFWLMYRMLTVSYALTLLLAIPAAGLLVRSFIIMHDCGHGSFFKSRRANEIVGWFTGVITLTPFAQWRKDHALHHASSGDLDRRGHGDIDTITVQEYLALPAKGRKHYRFIRNPFVMLLLGPLYLMISQRRLMKNAALNELQTFSVYSTNIAILAFTVGFSLWIGFVPFFLVYFPAIYLAASSGIALFYVQHQFEDAYWQTHENWDYATAAIQGSSYFRMNPILQWFTGNIGLHHVHHLGPRIPNYNLARAHAENEMFHDVTILDLRTAAKTLQLRLWDTVEQRMIDIDEVRRREALLPD